MQVDKIASPDRPKELYTYRIAGSGQFPLDMLRYDMAFPASETDTALAFDTRHRHIRITSHKAPTVARWLSFGWTVE